MKYMTCKPNLKFITEHNHVYIESHPNHKNLSKATLNERRDRIPITSKMHEI